MLFDLGLSKDYNRGKVKLIRESLGKLKRLTSICKLKTK